MLNFYKFYDTVTVRNFRPRSKIINKEIKLIIRFIYYYLKKKKDTSKY